MEVFLEKTVPFAVTVEHRHSQYLKISVASLIARYTPLPIQKLGISYQDASIARDERRVEIEQAFGGFGDFLGDSGDGNWKMRGGGTVCHEGRTRAVQGCFVEPGV